MNLSIISLSYNQVDKIKRLYTSLKSQKEYIHEWVIYDDGSTDGTLNFIGTIDDIHVIFLQEKHIGKHLTHHFNKALKRASGDIILQLFGDTYLGEGSLKHLMESYIPHTAGSAYEYEVDERGNIIAGDYRMDGENDSVINISQMARPWYGVTGSGLIAMKEDLVKIGGADEKYIGYGRDDTDIFLRLMMNGCLLYCYNNVKVYHHTHGNENDAVDNVSLLQKKEEGSGYLSNAEIISLDFDDFSLENNNLYYLDLLKQQYPQLKVSLFMIPLDVQYYHRIKDFQRKEAIKQLKERMDWIELIPHGMMHIDREFEKAPYKAMDAVIKAIDKAFSEYDLPYVKGFKAPQWLYSNDLVRYMDEKGWWIAVDRNQPEAQRTNSYHVYTHSIDEPYWLCNDRLIKLHGHISQPSRNNLPDNMLQLMKMNKKADFKFASEVLVCK